MIIFFQAIKRSVFLGSLVWGGISFGCRPLPIDTEKFIPQVKSLAQSVLEGRSFDILSMEWEFLWEDPMCPEGSVIRAVVKDDLGDILNIRLQQPTGLSRYPVEKVYTIRFVNDIRS